LTPRKPYEVELAELERPFDDVVRWAGIDMLREPLMAVACSPALFVGSGGTLAVARLAAMLHEQVGGQPARVVTPLELATLPAVARSGVVLFSAGLSHPDALGALAQLAGNRLRPAVVVTFRDADAVAGIVPADVHAVVLPQLEFREGFLATTSVLVMAAALVRAYGGDGALPAVLPRPTLPQPTAAEQLLVLTTPGLAPVATDIETRCHELGLASVQVTDYRNFAHGRHVGLLRRAKTTSVLGLVDQPLERLAMATLDVLPRDEICSPRRQRRSPRRRAVRSTALPPPPRSAAAPACRRAGPAEAAGIGCQPGRCCDARSLRRGFQQLVPAPR